MKKIEGLGFYQWKKVINSFAVIFAVVLFIEMGVFQLSTWSSLVNRVTSFFSGEYQTRELAVTELEGAVLVEGSAAEGNREEIIGAGVNDIEVTGEDGMTIHLRQIQDKIRIIELDAEFLDMTVVPYSISLTDEGNAYPYSLPNGQIVEGVKKSKFLSLYPFGKVKDLSIYFDVPPGTIVSLKSITVNGIVTPEARLERIFILFVFALLFLLLKRKENPLWKPLEERNPGQIFLGVFLLLLLIGGAFKLAHVNPVCIQSPWPHHKQYQELARAMAEGRLSLPIEVSEGLANAPNPYDTIYLQAGGIDYKADYAYRDGSYYVYFGVVPVLLFYLPYFLLTGKDFPNYAAVFLFYSGFLASVFFLYREMIRRWFRETPYLIYLMLCILTAGCGNYLFVIARPDLYDTPIMAALMFTTAGMFFWLRGKYSGGRVRVFYLLAGSASMALVAGCRPQLLLFSALAIPLFWTDVMKERTLFGKKGIGATLAFALPYIIVAGGIMYYNAARFGSPFDFGATYSLTSNDMTHRSYNLHQTLLGIWYFFFQPPYLTPEFPFIAGNQIAAPAYPGRLTSEYIYGGVLVSNAFLWILLFAGKAKDCLKQKGILAFFYVSLGIAGIIGIVDVSGAGILQRYTVDLIWGIWLSAVILWLAFAEKRKEARYERMIVLGLYFVCVLQFFYGFGVIFGNGDLSVNVRTSNPQLFYTIQSIFTIW